jgi:hypothetical protein
MITRRAFVAGGGVAFVVGCKKPSGAMTCSDVSGLSAEEINARTMTAYVDRSMEIDKTCVACVQYIDAPSGGCGGCKVLKGPVHPLGTCKLFAKKI